MGVGGAWLEWGSLLMEDVPRPRMLYTMFTRWGSEDLLLAAGCQRAGMRMAWRQQAGKRRYAAASIRGTER